MLSNNQSQSGSLDSTLGKASQMLQTRAYLHHFERFGVDRAQIE